MDLEKMNLFGDDNTKISGAKSKKHVNRTYQDTFFKCLFKEPKYRKELYLMLHPEDKNVTDTDFEDVELTNIFMVRPYNDICFLVHNRLIVLVEHQSTLNPNMPLRMLQYVAEEYNRMIQLREQRKFIYGKKLIQLPSPEFYIVYTGDKQSPKEMKLSDAFYDHHSDFLQLHIKVLTEENSSGAVQEFLSIK